MSRPASPFILASDSLRRRQLLEKAGYSFEVISPAVDEAMSPSLTLRELTTLNATRKARAVARASPGSHVLAADTLVALEGDVIGKPNDLDHAAEILQRLSGRAHDVCTAVAIRSSTGRSLSFHTISRVYFRELDRKTITSYIAKINPLDKAGAYAAQGSGAEIIARIEGSYTNVVGLPMEETARALRELGIAPGKT